MPLVIGAVVLGLVLTLLVSIFRPLYATAISTVFGVFAFGYLLTRRARTSPWPVVAGWFAVGSLIYVSYMYVMAAIIMRAPTGV